MGLSRGRAMPVQARKVPSYRLHKPTGQAVVRLDGRDVYLGKHGTEAGPSTAASSPNGCRRCPAPAPRRPPGRGPT